MLKVRFSAMYVVLKELGSEALSAACAAAGLVHEAFAVGWNDGMDLTR